jgi:arylsulfatase A-like enzyme
MMHTLRHWWRGEVVGAVLMVPVAVVGVVLPLDFVTKLDSYLKYLQLREMPMVFAWSWLFYGLCGLAMAMIMVIPVIVAGKLLGRSPALWVARVCTWLALSIMTLALLQGARLWIETSGLPVASLIPRIRWLGLAAITGCAVWIWRRSTIPEGLMHAARLGAIGGLTLTALSPLAAVITTAAPPAPSVVAHVEPTATQRPNIILITLDALAADHASLHGYGRPTTPNLERLARQANLFERFYANGNYTVPTVNSLIHGVRPWTHRAAHPRGRPDLDIAQYGLVPRLKNAGYYTTAVATNVWADPIHTRSAQWFDQAAYARMNWFSLLDYLDRLPYSRPALDLRFLSTACAIAQPLLDYVMKRSSVDHFDPELALSTARRFVEDRDTSRPIFLWVHLFPPHSPYATPEPFIGQFDTRSHARTTYDSTPPQNFLAREDPTFPERYVGRYDESIAYVDHHVGQFIEWLNRRGLFDDALLVVSTDHGESFVKDYGGHAGPMMHDALIHIPLIIKEPRQRAGKRLDVLAEQIDLLPTVLNLAGIPVRGRVEGRSLRPAIQGERMEGAVFSMSFEQSNRFGKLDTGSVAMIEGRWKYVHYRGKAHYPLMPNLEDSLYDVQSDPGENVNLITAEPAVAAAMRSVIEEKLRLHGGPLK